MKLRPLLERTAIVAIAALTTCCAQPQHGSKWATLQVGDRERSYLLHLPPGQPSSGRPLVVALHGRMGNGVQMESSSGFSKLADREGFTVAYPDGVRRSWNDARGESPAAHAGVDDVAFIGALIDDVVARHGVDAKRVYVAGASNGGMMSFRLACELSPKIAAVGAVIALMPTTNADRCAPTHPMPMMIIAGTEDPLIPFGGGSINGDVMSARDTRERWAALAGCGPVGPTIVIDNVDDGTRVHRAGHTRCRSGAEVVLDSVEGGGHTWPSGSQYLPALVVGRVTRELDGAAELWRFFERHTLDGVTGPKG